MTDRVEVTLDDAGKRRVVDAGGARTLLDLLQRAGISVDAPCGGAGKCGRCLVLVRDEGGLGYRLACKTKPAPGMEVFVQRAGAMQVACAGSAAERPPVVPDGPTCSAAPEAQALARPARAASVGHAAGEKGLGMAVDLGTTTLVARLHDLESGELLASVARTNPQVVFGADVISRISASAEGKLGLMTAAIREALVSMKDALCALVGARPAEVSRVAVAGNTVMQHILAGLPPDSIGAYPFEPLSLFGDGRAVEGVGEIHFARCIAGYVGGDVTAGLLACGFPEGGVRLLIDLGTNGEMALAAGGRILCCATAAGPVFEGANIRLGMPAYPGAVCKVSYAGGRIALETVDGARPIGICGTGIVDAVALMVRLGVVDETGRLLGVDELADAGEVAAFVGTVSGRNVFMLDEGGALYITQEDVRNVQLAKAAICAGVLTLADEAGIGLGDIDSLAIAGGFGAYLDLDSAAVIGLFPPELRSRAESVGNTSAEGASALLVSDAARTRAQAIADACDYLELSTSSAFNVHYLDSMGFGS